MRESMTVASLYVVALGAAEEIVMLLIETEVLVVTTSEVADRTLELEVAVLRQEQPLEILEGRTEQAVADAGSVD